MYVSSEHWRISREASFATKPGEFHWGWLGSSPPSCAESEPRSSPSTSPGTEFRTRIGSRASLPRALPAGPARRGMDPTSARFLHCRIVPHVLDWLPERTPPVAHSWAMCRSTGRSRRRTTGNTRVYRDHPNGNDWYCVLGAYNRPRAVERRLAVADRHPVITMASRTSDLAIQPRAGTGCGI